MKSRRWRLGTRMAEVVAWLVASVFLCAPIVRAGAQGEGKTLREVLAAEKVPRDVDTLHNLDAKISSGAELNDAQQFVIAYYLLDATGQLNPPIFVDF